MAVGLVLLLPAYAIGGMGAGDVKLLAGVGAWVHATHTFYAFCATAIVGAVLAVGMVLVRRAWRKHCQSVLDDSGRDHDDPRPESAVEDCGRTQELDAATALWDSDRDRVNCLLCLDGDA